MLDLARIYLKYAVKKNLKAEIVSEQDGQIIIEIEGKNALKTFENEIGKHSVQRVPPTESKGRRHTSVLTVTVLPIETISVASDLGKDVEIKTQGGSGPGGQHQNKSDSAVRATHKPTGISVFINGRSQYQNKQSALAIIAARLQEFEREKLEKEMNAERQNQISNQTRGDKRRTWNFIDNRITDHLLGTKTTQITKVMRGDLDLIY